MKKEKLTGRITEKNKMVKVSFKLILRNNYKIFLAGYSL